MELNNMPEKPTEPMTLDDEGFKMAVKKYPLIVFDFWATWCPPCKMMIPIVDQLAKAHAGKVAFAKINTDEHQQIAAEHGISAIPTFLIFKDGELVDRITGAMAKPEFEKKITKFLK